MNLRKGLQRFYIVLTIAWVVACLYSLWPTAQYVPNALLWDKERSVDPLERANAMPSYSHPEEVQAYVTKEFGTDAWHGWHHVASIVWFRLAVIAFVPPTFFYFLFFYVGRWVFRGFKEAQRTEPVGR